VAKLNLQAIDCTLRIGNNKSGEFSFGATTTWQRRFVAAIKVIVVVYAIGLWTWGFAFWDCIEWTNLLWPIYNESTQMESETWAKEERIKICCFVSSKWSKQYFSISAYQCRLRKPLSHYRSHLTSQRVSALLQIANAVELVRETLVSSQWGRGCALRIVGPGTVRWVSVSRCA